MDVFAVREDFIRGGACNFEKTDSAGIGMQLFQHILEILGLHMLQDVGADHEVKLLLGLLRESDRIVVEDV